MATGHTITVNPAGRHVVISLDGVKLAESDNALVLHETGLPARYYLPPEDVRAEFLQPTDTHTSCPFKGEASYWSVQVGDQVHKDLVWSYPEPIPSVAEIAGLQCFYAERVEQQVS
jgi:uncharacterized protein (DUF427 family)